LALPLGAAALVVAAGAGGAEAFSLAHQAPHPTGDAAVVSPTQAKIATAEAGVRDAAFRAIATVSSLARRDEPRDLPATNVASPFLVGEAQTAAFPPSPPPQVDPVVPVQVKPQPKPIRPAPIPCPGGKRPVWHGDR
jgi:hypothetical protein